jgi:predicted GNAT family N-acyltransferase
MGEALAIRLRVFVEEQGVPLELEIDEHDRDDREAVHALIRENGAAIATGRYYVLGKGSVQIGRMAVLPPWRGRGAGARLLDLLLAEAIRHGFAEARLDAQSHATQFYRKYGFSDFGEEHLDAGIVHRPMRKPLF